MERREIKDFKCVWIRKDVHKEISSYGSTGETYGDVIEKIVKFYREHNKHSPKEDIKGKKK